MDDLLVRSAEEMFTRHAPSGMVRAIRAGASPAALWGEIEASGFLDALVPEEAGGIGLRPEDVLPVLMAQAKVLAAASGEALPESAQDVLGSKSSA